MRVSWTSPFTGVTTTERMSLEELEYKKLVEEIDREKFEKEIPRLRLATYPKSALEQLPGKELFSESLVKHIFEGELNAKGNAVGYHYEGIEDTDGKIIPGTKSEPNEFGVYEGRVSVKGVSKKRSSTFFPREWSPWQVAHAILEAYNNKNLIQGTKFQYEGLSESGITVKMFIQNSKIVSAYPIKE